MPTLTWEHVYAWRCAQHSLEQRAPASALAQVAGQIGALHAQLLSAAELSAWARVDGLGPDDVTNALWQDRTLVKTWTMRGTLHLHPAADLPLYVAALSLRNNYRSGAWLKYYGVTLAEIDAILDGVRAALDGRCLTREQLADAVGAHTGLAHVRELLLSGWGVMLKPAAYQGSLCFGPPQGQAVTFVRPDQWLPGWVVPGDPQAALETIARRYLAAYGPATHEDFGRWWGMDPAPARRLFSALGHDLVAVQIEDWKGWALAETVDRMAATPPSDTVRLLPHFDPLIVVGLPQRRYQMPETLKDRVYRQAGWVSPVLLVGGRMAGTWEMEKRRAHTTVTVTPFARLTAAITAGLEAEAARLGTYLGTPVDVQIGAA